MDEALEDFANICAEPPAKRNICSRCERPFTVCFCQAIPAQPVEIRNHVIMLQHPNELKRCLRTTKILELALPTNHYHLFRGKYFSMRKYPILHQLLAERENILVYPSPDSKSMKTLPIGDVHCYNIVLLDGTWSQAKALFNCNPFLQTIKCICLDNTEPSRYVIRTQPTEICLSTVEAAGLVLAQLEPNASIFDTLTRPLKTICDYQLNNGAVEHQSKEYLITNGLYTKPLNKKLQKQLDSKQTQLNAFV